jgi:DNA polymerase III epsilon subunit-like protein
MTKPNIEKFATLDFEASSLSQESWPIEVGLSWLTDGEVQTWSTLIRPAANWELSDWAPQSAAVHGIALEELEDAPVAYRFVAICWRAWETGYWCLMLRSLKLAG